MVRKIQGKGESSLLGHLNVNNSKVTSKKDISNTLADIFSKNSSPENYSQKCKNIKQQKEKRNLKDSMIGQCLLTISLTLGSSG